MSQFEPILYTGVILNDFSREGSGVYNPLPATVHIRFAPDPSQAQDDPFCKSRKFKLSRYRLLSSLRRVRLLVYVLDE